jgi:acetoin utilization protein AcuC
MRRETLNPLFIYSDVFLGYKFHHGHPFNQKRLEVTRDLLETMGHLSLGQIVAPRPATDQELSLIHDPVYINAVKQLGSKQDNIDREMMAERFGLGTEDTPIFKNMHEMTSLIVGGSLLGADLIMQGQTTQVLNIAGGLHHAFQSRAAGFCIYNDCSVVISYLRQKYNVRVLYIDTDAHHGDGVQWAFYNDPNVFTFSIHETGRYLFPGSGHITERGEEHGYGYSLNIPLDAFTQDESFLSCFSEALDEVVEFFKPDIIVSQNGCDAHFFDPLTHLSTSMKVYEEIPKLVKHAATKYSHGRWLAIGGGGYDIWRVVPRAWSLIWMVMNDLPIVQQPLPEIWRERWEKEATVPLPYYLLDNPEQIPIIPRKKEIEEQNELTKTKSLYYFRQERFGKEG